MPKVSSYPVSKKLSVLDWHKTHGSNLHKTSREFKIDRKRIREWISKENLLRQHDYGKLKDLRKLGAGGKPLSDEMDDELFEFMETERSAGRAVGNKCLRQEAVRIAGKLNLPNFKASAQFLSNWKKRFHVSMRKGTNESQKSPEELTEAIQSFRDCIRKMRTENDYTLYNIANMDQTMVRFDNPANRTYNVVGQSTIRIANTGCKKRGFTVALCARASGHKLPAFCIFKEPSGRIPPRVKATLKIPSNVKISATRNGWMTAELFAEWINRVWGSNVDDVRRILVLDRAPIHASANARLSLESVDTDVAYVPAGCTGLIQPADVSWNKPFKTVLSEKWKIFMRNAEKNAKGNFIKPNRQDMINFVSAAWAAVSEKVVSESFQRCAISNALDGSEDGLLHSDLAEIAEPSHEDLQEECVALLFDDYESENSFDGFSEDEV